jgi:reverse transcriptase-like protein
MDWGAVIDPERARQNCYLDIYGDWYRDPWGWPELEWVVDAKHISHFFARLDDTGTARAAKLNVAKENFTTRPALVLDPIDRLAYQALTDRISLELIGNAAEWVYGWRLPPTNPQRGHYAKNDFQWENYRDHLREAANLSTFALKTDVVSCFATVPVDRACERITELAGQNNITKRLADMIKSWSLIPERNGLPQRNSASAVIANMYMAPLDAVLADYEQPHIQRLSGRSRGKVTRWMDDIWVFGYDRGRLRRAQLELQDSMRQLGLNMNTGKTDVLEGDEMRNAAQRIEHSAVDDALPEDKRPLEELVEELLDSPEKADRTSIRFATKRMRDNRAFEKVPEIAAKAQRLPHGSDALARLFRDSQSWRDLDDWFVEYGKSPWGSIDWSLAQFGTMFPTNEKPKGGTAEFLAEQLASTHSLILASLCVQRLVAWQPGKARELIRELAKSADHALMRRSLAMGACMLKEERAFIRQLMAEFKENRLTLMMLEDMKFAAPKVPADFQ